MIDLLRRLVEIESPSDDRAALDRFATAVQERFAEFGSIHLTDTPRGRHLRLEVNGQEQPHAVALCHYDTVWPLGTLDQLPFSVDADGVARGPGCFDMKSGMVLLYFALQSLRANGIHLRRSLRVLFTCDEEV